MVVDTALYDVLGVAANATTEQISQAYKKMSKEHHPDRGGTHEMMQQINAAKEVLTDPKKRDIYDRYGLKGLQSGIGESPFGDHSGFPSGLSDIFDLLTRGRTSRNQPTKPQGSDIKHSLKVSLEELYSGNTKTISVDREIICTDCAGTGSVDRMDRECMKCEGQGIEIVMFQRGPFIQQIQRKCSSCNGKGSMINSTNRCKNCHGNKLIRLKNVFNVVIAPGSHDGEAIKFIGEGNQIPKGDNGTLFAILKQEPHAMFTRIEDNLTMKMKINLSESLCGFERIVTLLDGHKVMIKHPPGKPILPDSYRCIKGQGMPNRHTHSHGDLIIHFDVEFPEENFIKNEEHLKQLEALLPAKQPIKLNKKEKYEETEMMECEKPSKKSRQQRFTNGNHHDGSEDKDYNSDDGAEDADHPQVGQCQTQ